MKLYEPLFRSTYRKALIEERVDQFFYITDVKRSQKEIGAKLFLNFLHCRYHFVNVSDQRAHYHFGTCFIWRQKRPLESKARKPPTAKIIGRRVYPRTTRIRGVRKLFSNLSRRVSRTMGKKQRYLSGRSSEKERQGGDGIRDSGKWRYGSGRKQ